jgi:ubiquinone/menaquinone biosynthesis C-methylase UbiE
MAAFYRRLLFHVLRVFFSLLYNQFAWSYDLVAWLVSLGNWTHWVSMAADELPGPEILELGHGPGYLQSLLSRSGLKPTGLDLSPHMGRIAIRKLHGLEIKPRLVRGRAQYLPFKDGAFHQVAATFPSEYIFEPQTLTETYRVLVPGGRLVVIPAAWITGKKWLERLAAWLFKITGQAILPDSCILNKFEDAGFSMHYKRLAGETWEILIMIAEKPPVPTRQN